MKKKGLIITVFGIILLTITSIALFAQSEEVVKSADSGLLAIAAAVAVGLGSLGAGIAVAKVASAAVGAISEKPELSGRVLLFVGLAEGIAIYGLIVAIMLLGKI